MKWQKYTKENVPQRSDLGTQKDTEIDMGWLRLVGSLKLYVSFAKEPYQRDYILQKRPIILRSLLSVATPYKKAREYRVVTKKWKKEM